ncbi:MAG: hypothetical protein U5L03_09020 [Burkholderiaceae bacterium]|nr:hypothetical protein [Burkholderiaceae bacterium]
MLSITATASTSGWSSASSTEEMLTRYSTSRSRPARRPRASSSSSATIEAIASRSSSTTRLPRSASTESSGLSARVASTMRVGALVRASGT